MEERKILAVKEDRKKIERIKKKYKNFQMSDKDAQNIRRLEITNNVLKGATALVGIIAAIDLVIPDPILGLDEAALVALTTLIGSGVKIVDNKIDLIAKGEDSSFKLEEINKLSEDLTNTVNSVSSSRKKK